jgi:hypothetical protein
MYLKILVSSSVSPFIIRTQANALDHRSVTIYFNQAMEKGALYYRTATGNKNE